MSTGNSLSALENAVEAYLEDIAVLPGWIARQLEAIRRVDEKRVKMEIELEIKRKEYLNDLQMRKESSLSSSGGLFIIDDKNDENLQYVLNLALDCRALLCERIALIDQSLHVIHHDYKRLKYHYSKLQSSHNSCGKLQTNGYGMTERSNTPFLLSKQMSCVTRSERRTSSEDKRLNHLGDSRTHSDKEDTSSGLPGYPSIEEIDEVARTSTEVDGTEVETIESCENARFAVSLSSGVKRNRQGDISEDRKKQAKAARKNDNNNTTSINNKTSLDNNPLSLSNNRNPPIEVRSYGDGGILEEVRLVASEGGLGGDSCPLCSRGELSNEAMVACDACQRWYHFSCAQYNPVSNVGDWYCSSCVRDGFVVMPNATPSTLKSSTSKSRSSRGLRKR